MATVDEVAASSNMVEVNGVKIQPSETGREMAVEKRKLDDPGSGTADDRNGKRRRGTAPIREEYLVQLDKDQDIAPKPEQDAADDDAAEAFHHKDRASGGNGSKRRQKKKQGQNTARKFGKSRDEVALCSTRAHAPESSPVDCKYGSGCRFEHDLRKYLREHKREDLTTFEGICPIWQVKGYCTAGWKCRFVGSHSEEIERFDGKKELVLVEKEGGKLLHGLDEGEETGTGVANIILPTDRISLAKRKVPTPKSDIYLKWLDSVASQPEKPGGRRISFPSETVDELPIDAISKDDNRALYTSTPLLPSEKRRLYFSASTPVLAPLTTQGNLPFRRLCTTLGATFTYSEMAMSLPLIQGHRAEWALIKAHESELQPPTFTSKTILTPEYPLAYNPATDIRFSAQIAANKPWFAVKATEVLTALLPSRSLRAIDLNVGCPIDLVYRDGAGSALMDSPSKLEKILHGMNAVSGPTPITCKIRMGTRDGKPTAQKLVERLVLGGGNDALAGGSGVAAITLHGRSRQQRYTRSADWEYISATSALIKQLNAKADVVADTIHAPDPRTLPADTAAREGQVYFLGNGDMYTPQSYQAHLEVSGVDAIMLARGALQKPWLFEEIAAGQMLDKSSSERLAYIEQFCRYGLEAWGSDEWGVGTTRRFLLEWLSFACRYVPVGLLERVAVGGTSEGGGDGSGWVEPSLQDRAPAYRGRDELETLMASEDYQDWIKISEMFLGPAHKDFRFQPKHKSNAYDEVQAEG